MINRCKFINSNGKALTRLWPIEIQKERKYLHGEDEQILIKTGSCFLLRN